MTASDMMNRDPLTGVYSRAGLHDRLQAEMARARDRGESLSLLVLDLDYLKSINDAFGHRRGDEVLVELVERLRVMTRSSDSLFRIGGDEFIVVLPGTGKREATEVALRLLEGVRSPQFGGEPPLTISISVGVAAFPDESENVDKLIEIADLRAYEAKRSGRGQVVSEERPVADHSFVKETSSRLVERDQALEQLRRWLDALSEQRRGVLAVSGPRGSGRSRFLEEVEKTTRLRGYFVVEGSRPELGNAQEPAEGSSEEQEASPVRSWREGLGEIPPAGAGAESLREAIKKHVEAGGYRGVIFVVDDLPSLDSEVMEAIHSLFDDSRVEQVALAYSGNRTESRRLLPPRARVETVYIQGLSPQGMRVWLRSLLQWECPATLIEWLYKETGGLPACIKEGLSYLVERGLLEQREGTWAVNGDVTKIALGAELGIEISRPPNNLPAVPYSFVGRHRETEEIKGLLREGRLVMITGPGGIGKTHLAVHAASVMLDQFEDGVFFVPLGAISNPDLVASTLAQTLGVVETGGKSPSEAVKEYLRDKEMLLVLDNFEQVLDAAVLVSDLLSGCPLVKVLATSREALRVRGEQVFDLQPLALPEEDIVGRGQGVETLAGYPAIAMFVQCAHAARPDFALTDDNAPTVAAICARLDGLPLAIELVAARIKLLSPGEILARLKDPGGQEALRLLTGGPRDMPNRHRTMHAAIGWSYDLLSDEEKLLFTWLGVFAGGFTLDAAEQVAGDGEEVEDVFDLVSSLLDKSLLRRAGGAGDGEARFAMLETIREYALERLEARGAAAELKRRHADYYLALAERAEPLLVGPEQKRWLGVLASEYGNMRAALAWTLEAGEWEMLAQIASLFWRLWYLQGPVGEGRAWLGHALAHRAELSIKVRARALQGAGVLARSQGDPAQAKALLEEGLGLWRELGDKQGLSGVLNSLGLLAIEQGHYDQAQPYLEESADLDRERGDKQRLAVSLNNLGGVAYFRGDYPGATRFYTESLQLRREMGDKWGIANSLYNLGEVAQHEGDYEQASALYKESLVLRQEVGDKRGICICLDGLAAVAMYTGQHMLSCILLGAVDALREATSAPRPAAAQAEYERLVSEVRKEVEEEDYSRGCEGGRRMGFEEAVTLALSA
ncbi:MAG TPA: diguanylate cyclase [Chloroflexia bacterium]|nr:diguanylate cyclase [Chloroflexia bacterium]